MSSKLKSLQYPNEWNNNNNNNSFENLKDIKLLVIWLENFKIRQYTKEKREENLSILLDDSKWIKGYKDYLNDLECSLTPPLNINDINNWKRTIDWLLNKAIQLEYIDNSKDINNAQTSIFSGNSNKSINITIDNDKFNESVNNLASLLGINNNGNNNNDSVALLQSCVKLIIRKFSPSVLEHANDSTSTKNNDVIPINNYHLGFSTNDKLVDNAIKVLHLLYIADQRILQTEINKLIVAIQTFTADPKTDSSLGKVGR